MKKTTKLSIFATVLAVIVFIWFDTRTGLQGCFNWHILIRNINTVLFCTLFLPAIFGIIAKLKNNKLTQTLSYIFSIFVIVLWLGAFCFLSYSAHYLHDNSGLNIVKQNEPLPTANSRSEEALLGHYAFASDPHWGADTRNSEACVNILKQIDSRDYDTFFLLGDVAEFAIFPECYDAAIKDLRQNLTKTKYRIIPGNHDALVNGLPIFKSTFMDKDEKFFFRMDGDRTHLLFLNMLWDESELTKKQEKWLEKQLQEIPQEDTVIVLSHCYVVSSGYYDPIAGKNWGDLHKVMDRLCPIFDKYNVDLHLSGHDHFFEYLEKDNMDYYVLGTMGGKLDEDLIYHSPYSKWCDNEHFGWLDMKVYDGYMTLTSFDQFGNELHTVDISTK